ncbi:MAG: hypothetical protein AAF998_22875 [Bacteroidota bacterium]
MKYDGTVHAMGYGTNGALGNGSTANATTPVQVLGICNARDIYSGGANSECQACAILDNGRMRCWGRNISGQLGIGNQINSPVPARVRDLDEKIELVDHAQRLILPPVESDHLLFCRMENENLIAKHRRRFFERTLIDCRGQLRWESEPTKPPFELPRKIATGNFLFLLLQILPPPWASASRHTKSKKSTTPLTWSISSGITCK